MMPIIYAPPAPRYPTPKTAHPIRQLAWLLGCLLLSGLCHAETQDWQGVRNDIQQQLAAPGSNIVMHWEPGNPPALPRCDDLDYQWPSKRFGRIAVVVHCRAPQEWRVRMAMAVSAKGMVGFLRNALPRDHIISSKELDWREVELGNYPDDAVRNSDAIDGEVLRQDLAGDQALRHSQLRARFLVHQQQQVHVRVLGQGFEISAEGKALGDAAVDESVSVILSNGKQVQGTAQADGTVTVRP